MLSVISQDGTRKYDINYYFIVKNELKIIGSFGNVIGEYSTLEKALKVFEMMIKAEEQQNSFDNVFDMTKRYCPCKHFEIFRMPQDDEVKE